MDSPDPRTKAPIVPTWAADAALVSAVTTVALYVVGWSFNFGFYTFFGIDPNLFDDGLAETLTAAFEALIVANNNMQYNVWIFLLAFVAFPILLESLRKWLGDVNSQDVRLTRTLLGVAGLYAGFLSLVLLSGFCRTLGESSARTLVDSSSPDSGHPRVRVRYVNAVNSLSPSMLLIKASSEYVALHGDESVMIVPREQIAAILWY